MKAEIFYNGMANEPRLDHPEGVAVAPDGAVWCGGEDGQLYRIDPDGASAELITTSGGFLLGVNFAPDGTLYACDLDRQVVLRMPAGKRDFEVFADGVGGHSLQAPNDLVVDGEGRLYVTDSSEDRSAIVRLTPDGGGEVWYDEPLAFANGIDLAPTGEALYVVESFLPGITRIAIGPDGSRGERAVVAELPGTVPDGVTVGPDGLYVGCYEPSQVLRITGHDTGEPDVQVAVADPTAHLLCHPANVAFRGDQMFTSNLGRWHITTVSDVTQLATRPLETPA